MMRFAVVSFSNDKIYLVSFTNGTIRLALVFFTSGEIGEEAEEEEEEEEAEEEENVCWIPSTNFCLRFVEALRFVCWFAAAV